MFKAISVGIVWCLLTAAATAQEPCDLAGETRALRQTLAELVRVEIVAQRLSAARQRVAELRQQRLAQVTRRDALQSATLTEKDLAHLESVNPTRAEEQRQKARSNQVVIGEIDGQISAADDQIRTAESQIEELLKELTAIERRLSPPPASK